MIRTAFICFALAGLTFGCATLYQKPDPLVGMWDYELHYLPRGEPEGVMTITKESGVYSVVMKSPSNEHILEGVVIEGNTFVSGNFSAEGYSVDVSGTFEEDAFEGQIDAEGNVFKMTATKQG